MLVSFFASSLKRTVPQQRWDTYLISSGEWSEIDVSRVAPSCVNPSSMLMTQITGPLGIENKLLGYVFLVDQNAKIRWAACGDPRQEEIEDLRRCAAVLVRRMSEDKDK